MKLNKSTSLRSKIIWFDKALIFLFFLSLHLVFFNINVAEWGDSYRFLRASEIVRNFSYPADEKRPPLFSIILAVRPNGVEQILWGRAVVLVFSIFLFILFNSFVSKYVKERKYQNLALVLFTLNPVLFYWSIRIMSDIPFALFSLLALYFVSTWKILDVGRSFLLGFIVGLSILTRFEGYICFLAVLIGILFFREKLNLSFLNPRLFFKHLWKKLPYMLTFMSASFLTILPYLLFRNPFASAYLGEPTGRSYDFKTIWIYVASLAGLFGFVLAPYFIVKGRKVVWEYLAGNVGIFAFLVMELVLILIWPAAMPRLFVAILPFLILLLVLAYSDGAEKKISKKGLILALCLIAFFVVSQYFLKLQFLIPNKIYFALLVFAQFVGLILLFLKRTKAFLLLTFLSVLSWSFFVVWIQKDIFISIKNAAQYASLNVDGVVGYNDVSSVSDWYLNYSGTPRANRGFYYNAEVKKNLEFNTLLKSGVDYLLLTNEHNITMTLDLEKRPYLAIIKEFRYNVDGKDFFAEVVKFNKEWQK